MQIEHLMLMHNPGFMGLLQHVSKWKIYALIKSIEGGANAHFIPKTCVCGSLYRKAIILGFIRVWSLIFGAKKEISFFFLNMKVKHRTKKIKLLQ